MRKWLHLRLSLRTGARLAIICEGHHIKMSDLVSSILEDIDDETLLKAVRPLSKVLRKK